MGTLNCIFSDGEHLFCYRDKDGYNGLCFVERTPPYGGRKIIAKDEDWEIDLGIEKSTKERGFIVATRPLTDESWVQFSPGELAVLRSGKILYPLCRKLTNLRVGSSPSGSSVGGCRIRLVINPSDFGPGGWVLAPMGRGRAKKEAQELISELDYICSSGGLPLYYSGREFSGGHKDVIVVRDSEDGAHAFALNSGYYVVRESMLQALRVLLLNMLGFSERREDNIKYGWW